MSLIPTITPTELQRLQTSGDPVELIDVRTPAEYRSQHVAYATNAPFERLDPHAVMASRNGTRDNPLYLICLRGNFSKLACLRFMECGYDNVVSVAGGTLAAAEEGLPLELGKQAMSLECQVRTAAGFLVVLGVILGFAFSPYFTLLSAVVGGGLMYAGLTDTCPMSMWLAKMPWNQIPSGDGAQAKKEGTACCA
jgi:rhodanese-related sulfurtransferase